jgi:hypothetical protein
MGGGRSRLSIYSSPNPSITSPCLANIHQSADLGHCSRAWAGRDGAWSNVSGTGVADGYTMVIHMPLQRPGHNRYTRVEPRIALAYRCNDPMRAILRWAFSIDVVGLRGEGGHDLAFIRAPTHQSSACVSPTSMDRLIWGIAPRAWAGRDGAWSCVSGTGVADGYTMVIHMPLQRPGHNRYTRVEPRIALAYRCNDPMRAVLRWAFSSDVVGLRGERGHEIACIRVPTHQSPAHVSPTSLDRLISGLGGA